MIDKKPLHFPQLSDDSIASAFSSHSIQSTYQSSEDSINPLSPHYDIDILSPSLTSISLQSASISIDHIDREDLTHLDTIDERERERIEFDALIQRLNNVPTDYSQSTTDEEEEDNAYDSDYESCSSSSYRTDLSMLQQPQIPT